VGTVGDGDRGMRGRLGMDSKFAGMDGYVDKSLSPCRSLLGRPVFCTIQVANWEDHLQNYLKIYLEY